jgi:hypothetical protein
MSFLISKKSGDSVLRWAVGGWAFFIAENAVLSENRTWLIQELGDDNYHNVYGTFSTIATASIGFAYYKIRRSTMPPRWILWRRSPPRMAAAGSWIFLTTGLVMAAQVAPKMQVPVTMTSSGGAGSGGVGFQVRCPFDFSDKHAADNHGRGGSVRGLERVSRHPGLWSFGFIGLGLSVMAPTIPLRLWWL